MQSAHSVDKITKARRGKAFREHVGELVFGCNRNDVERAKLSNLLAHEMVCNRDMLLLAVVDRVVAPLEPADLSAALLSSIMLVVGISSIRSRVAHTLRSQRHSAAACESAMYSACEVEFDVERCCLEAHEIGPLHSMKRRPEVDRRVLTSPA